MKFAAIDFETANYRSDSPCQVAVVVVENTQRVIERSWLIRPKNLFFSERCIAVHGILPRHVLNEPEWDQVWAELSPIIDGLTLVAHNAMFDMAVLSSTLSAYDLVCPAIDFQCTRLIARRCWPGRTGYGLKPTAEALGISFRHHDALEDARACAEIALAAARVSAAETFEALEHQLSIQRGHVEYGNRVGPRCIRRGKDKASRSSPIKGKTTRSSPNLYVKTILDGCKGIRPLENKRLYFTGSLLGLAQADAAAFLAELGGAVESTLTPETDFWILGTLEGPEQAGASLDSDASVAGPNLLNSTDERPTLVISQRQLLAMIPGGLSAARAMM